MLQNIHHTMPVIQLHQDLTTTCCLLICPPCPQKSILSQPMWIALVIMEDGGYSLIFAMVTNPSIINVAAKSPSITQPLN